MRSATIDDATDIAAIWNIGITPAQVIQAMGEATFYVAPNAFCCWADSQLIAIVAADQATYRSLLRAYVNETDFCSAFATASEIAWLSGLPVTISPIGFTPIEPHEPAQNRVPVLYFVTADAAMLQAAL